MASSSSSSELSRVTAMEDLSMLAADCVVISCCCQCLILQILVFALIKLPCKLIKKTREFAMRKLDGRRRGSEMGSYEEIVRMNGEEYRCRVEAEKERVCEDEEGCMEEVERVMMAFYQNGEFGFGSFWGRQGSWGNVTSNTIRDQNDVGRHFLRYQIIEMAGSFSYT